MLFPPVHRVAGIVVSPREPQLWRQEVLPLQGPQLEMVRPLLSQPVFGTHQCIPVCLAEELLCGNVVLDHLQRRMKSIQSATTLLTDKIKS